jgi:tetratricopeptide (TPR) repeat protein
MLVRAIFTVLLGLAAAACEQMPKIGGDAPAQQSPAAPQITEASLRERAQGQLAKGAELYQAGEYEAAIKMLAGSLDHGLLSKQDQSRARKLMAFSHCVQGREAPCRDEFRKAFEINSDFSLTAAEDGHPIWGPVYRNVRTQLITEREASSSRKTLSSLLPVGKAEQMLADGIVKYDAGDYESAHKLLEAAVKEGLKDKADQVRAMKHAAFSLCLRDRFRDCRAAFMKIYEVDPNFDLTPAEAGHPSWTRTFASAKAQARKAQMDQASKEKASKDAKVPAPPAAAVPKKN